MLKPQGIISPLITPFNDEEQIEENALCHLVNHLIDSGVHGLFATGTTGEFFLLTPEERKRVWEITVDEARGRVPVYAGTMAVATRQVIAFNRLAEEAGVDAVVVMNPHFILPATSEIKAHYEQVATATPLPIVIYNNPNRSRYIVPVELVAELSQLPNIVAIKDSSGDMSLLRAYVRASDADFSVLCGLDLYVLNALWLGAKGAITASSNVVPRLLNAVYQAFRAGDLNAAEQAQNSLSDWAQVPFKLGTFPAGIKEALELMGFPAGPARRPIQRLSTQEREQLREALERIRSYWLLVQG